MNKYHKFYLELIIIYLLVIVIGDTIIMLLFWSYDFLVRWLLYIIIIAVFSFAVNAFYAMESFRRIQAGLMDSKWSVVKYDNTQFNKKYGPVKDKCNSCISSLHWKILEDNDIQINEKINRIIGITDYGITFIPDIFIIDISGFDSEKTYLHCSVRPYSMHFPLGSRRCKRRLKRLMECLSS
jgi:hypothetical protein